MTILDSDFNKSCLLTEIYFSGTHPVIISTFNEGNFDNDNFRLEGVSASQQLHGALCENG